MIEVRFSDAGTGRGRVARTRWVQKIVAGVLKAEKSGRSVSVFLTDDKEIRKINRRFLKHDYATDVISFWFEAGQLTGKESDHLGDLVVSLETAKRVAKEMGILFREELARYLIHGTLHLLGYDDKRPGDKKVMHRRQEKILDQLCTRAER